MKTTWAKTTDNAGWIIYRRGNCAITVSPDERLVTLFAPACTSMHANLTAAKRAAGLCFHKGW